MSMHLSCSCSWFVELSSREPVSYRLPVAYILRNPLVRYVMFILVERVSDMHLLMILT